MTGWPLLLLEGLIWGGVPRRGDSGAWCLRGASLFPASPRPEGPELDTRIQFVRRPRSVLESEICAGSEGCLQAAGGEKTGYAYSVSIGGSEASRSETATHDCSIGSRRPAEDRAMPPVPSGGHFTPPKVNTNIQS